MDNGIIVGLFDIDRVCVIEIEMHGVVIMSRV